MAGFLTSQTGATQARKALCTGGDVSRGGSLRQAVSASCYRRLARSALWLPHVCASKAYHYVQVNLQVS
jgi:hypothetical protein